MKRKLQALMQGDLFSLGLNADAPNAHPRKLSERPTDFPTDTPPCIPQSDTDGSEWGDFDSCLTEFRTNQCTLDGEPARIVGTPRTAPYATIEPVDLDAEPMRCCWDVVEMIMHDGSAFCRDDDDTDE